MKSTHLLTTALFLTIGALNLPAEVFKLADGTFLAGTLGVPSEVTIKTNAGERKVAFALLPPEVQRRYVPQAEVKVEPKSAAPAVAESAAAAPVTDAEIDTLANEVSLEAWTQAASIGSFRDKPEKRGPGGLVVTKAFNAIEENWVTIYSPKDAVGTSGNWQEQVARARELEARSPQFMQRRWLELFIKAGDALARRDSNEFAAAVRELKRSRVASENSRNFFTAK